MIENCNPAQKFSITTPSKPWVAIEGLGRQGSVAIVIDGENSIIQSEQVEEESKYSSSILPLIKKLLAKFALTAIDIKGLILVNGPGSFTGLRVTNGLVHGLAHGLDCPVVSVSAFEIYAFAWVFNSNKHTTGKDTVLVDVMIDARLEEFFLARVLCKKAVLAKNRNSQVEANFLNSNWEFFITEEPSVFDRPALTKRSLNNDVQILKCPNILDFKVPIFHGIEHYLYNKKLFLSGWASLFCLNKENLKWKKAHEVQPLYVRDRVAQTILERRESPSLIIEAFNEIDVLTISSIEKDTYKFGWTNKNFLDSLNSKYICKKLVNNSLLVGYFVWMIVEEECHILNFTIASGRQKRGLGKWMLSRLLVSLAEYKLKSVFLEVRTSNKSAINLYGKNGFEIVGRRKNYYPSFTGREDALVMKRPILINKSGFV